MEGAESGRKLKVFISYSRIDSDFAEDLLVALKACGFEAYLDKHDIAPGDVWERRIGRLIEAADSMVFVVSPDSVKSDRCADEIAIGEDRGKRILPVVWRATEEATTPERLSRLNYTFFSGEGRSFAKGLAQLASALNSDIDWIREHTRLGELAAEWKAKGESEALLLNDVALAAAQTWASERPREAPEPTSLQRSFIAASEAAIKRRIAEEKAREAAIKDAEINRIRAEQEADKLKLEVLERGRQRNRVAIAGLIVLAGLGAGTMWQQYRYEQQRADKQRVELEATKEREAAARRLAERERRLKLAEVKYRELKIVFERSGGDIPAAAVPKERVPGQIDLSAKGGSSMRVSAKEARERISEDALDLILLYEVGGRETYEKRYAHPYWPGGPSGVNIGIGYDLGYVAGYTFEQHWQSRLSATDYERLSSTLGRTGDNAKALIATLEDIEIPWEMALEAFEASALPIYASQLESTFRNAKELHPDSYGALLSLIYNRGTSLNGESRKEMRAIADLMAQRRFAEVPDQIRAMKRLWAGKGLVGLLKRRDLEAQLFEKGLLEQEAEKDRVQLNTSSEDAGASKVPLTGQ